MNEELLIDMIYKKLEYAGFLHISLKTNFIIEFLKKRNWECICIQPDKSTLANIFEYSYPTIFHYSWIGEDYTTEMINFIKLSNEKEGWQKRFIVVGFESLSEEQMYTFLNLHYTKINKIDGNFFIHTLYNHYLNRK